MENFAMDLWTVAAVNPRKRRAKSRKPRSAAQKAATARMLAANRRTSNPRKRRARRASAPAAVASVRRRARRSVARARRSVSRYMGGSVQKNAMGLLKTGVVGAGGALAVDVAAGFIMPMLPAMVGNKLNADGSNNYLYFAAKSALAVGVAVLGAKVMKRETAHALAAGSITVTAYELLRPMVQGVLPASMNLGYMLPGRIMNPRAMSPGGLGVYDRTSGGDQGNNGLGRLGVYNNVMPIQSPNAQAGMGGRGTYAARRM